MTYTEKEYTNYVETLKNIQKIDWVKFHLALIERPNYWSIIEYGETKKANKRSYHEERMSKMIRWLLDPNGTHELGNAFAVRFLELVNQPYTYNPLKNRQTKVDTEFKFIDILYRDYSEDVFLAIELKQYSKEGTRSDDQSQLVHYDDVLQELASEDTQTVRVFLTPTKEEATNEAWQSVGYEQFIQVMDDVMANELATSTSPYREKTKLIIDDFKDELQRIVYTLKRDPRQVRNALSAKERTLTRILAEEINGERKRNKTKKLMRVMDDQTFDIEQVILLVREFIHVQDHSTSDESKILMRKLYNYLTEGEELSLDVAKTPPEDERTSTLSQDLIDANNLHIRSLQLTETGQGLHLKPPHEQYRLYLSSSGKGKFPGDYVQLNVMKDGEDTREKNSSILPNHKFELKDDMILDDKVMDKAGKVYDLEKVIQQYVIPALCELDHIGQKVVKDISAVIEE